jgi:hypothetical protein
MSEEVTIGEGPAFDRELPKQGSCAARVWKSFSVGLQPQKVGNPSPKVVVYFILPYKYTTGLFKGKRMLINQMYTAGFGRNQKKPTYLRRDVQAILNRAITDEEIKAGFKMNREIAGAPCLIQIIHNEGYANVGTVMSIPDGMPVFAPDPQADPADDYTPAYITKLLEKRLPEEKDTSDAPAVEKPTKEEEAKMLEDIF